MNKYCNFIPVYSTSPNKISQQHWEHRHITYDRELVSFHTKTKEINTVLLLILHPFNGLFSRTAWVSRCQKKMRQEMMGFGDAVASAGPYANNVHLAPDR